MADFGEDIAVSLTPDFRRFDEEYSAKVASMEHDPVSIPVAFKIDKAKLKTDLEAAARELGRSTDITVRVKLDTTAARAELARLRAESQITPAGAGGGGGGGGAGGIGLIGGLAAGGVALAPAAVGGFTGLAAAIGTATLAYRGFQQQAAAGSGFGATISGQIDQIKSAFGGLEQVAANAAGPGLVGGLKALQQAIPGLAPQVKELGTALGSFAGSAGSALVNTLQAASPLLSAFASTLTKAGEGIAAFTASDDFKQFLDNAAKELPTLVDLVGHAAEVFVELANAVTPLVSPLLSVADAIAKIVGALGHLPGGLGNAILAAGAGALLLGRGGGAAAAAGGSGGTGSGGGGGINVPILGNLSRANLGRLGSLAAVVGGADLASTGLSHHGFSVTSAFQSVAGGGIAGAGVGYQLGGVPGAGVGAVVGTITAGTLYLGKEGLNLLASKTPLPSLKVGTPGLGNTGKTGGYGDYIGAPGLGAGPNGMVIVGVNPSTGEPQYAPQGTRQISWDANGQPTYDQVGGTNVRPIATPYKPLPPSTYSGPNYGLAFPQPQLNAAGIYNSGSTQAINQTLAAAITSSPYRGAYDKDAKTYIGPQTTAAAGLSAADQRFGPAIAAMHSYDDALANVKTAEQDEARTEIAGAQQIAAAQEALKQARTNAAHTAILDAESIKNAEEGVTEARQNVADVTHQANESIASSEHALTVAQHDATDAQKNLTQARKDAVRDLQDYARAAIDSGDSLQSAQQRLQQLQLNQAARTGSMTPEQIFAAQNRLDASGNALDLKSASDQVTDAQIQHNRAVADNNEAQKKGVEGSPGVVSAKKQVADANYNVAQSEQNLADTRSNAAKSELEANKQLDKSVQTLSDTRRQAAWDRASSENSVRDAINNVKNAETNATQADNDAHTRTVQAYKDADTMGDNFKYAASEVGATTTQIRGVDKALGNGKRSLAMSYTAGDASHVTGDIINVQKDLYEAVLIAGGMSPAEAKKRADGTIKPPAAPAKLPPQTYGSATSAEAGNKATGGPIYGPGGPTEDKVGPYYLSAGEHVWTAKEVANAGGHKAVEGIRQYYRGMAEGGPVDPHQHGTLVINMAGAKLDQKVKDYGMSVIANKGQPSFGGGVSGGSIATAGGGMVAIWAALLANGFSPVVAAGILGNIQTETAGTFSPTIVQGGAHSNNPAAAGTGGYGLVQWTPGAKLIPLLHGQRPSVASEVAALSSQLHGPYRSVLNELNRSVTPSDAATLFGLNYEHYRGSVQPQRAEQAEAIYRVLHGAGIAAGEKTGGFFHPTGGFAANLVGHHNPPWPAPHLHQVSANARAASNFVQAQFGIPSNPDAARVDQFDHPWGKAIDNMLPNSGASASSASLGWKLANWFTDNPSIFGTKYVLFQNKGSDGSGWQGPGVAGHYNHVHVSLYDEGGMLKPGVTMAVNSSHKPEAVLNEPQWKLLRRLANGGSRVGMHVEHQHIYTPAAADMLVRVTEFAAMAGGGGL